MNYFQRKLYSWHNFRRDNLALTPGGPTPNGHKLIAYHEKEMVKLTKKEN